MLHVCSLRVWLPAFSNFRAMMTQPPTPKSKRSEQIIDPQVPQALRLQAILANGVVKIYNSQSQILLGDYTSALVSFVFVSNVLHLIST
jgi:hypothetical protein